MFFGKPQHEELKVDELRARARSMFSKKVEKVTGRCGRHLAAVESALGEFERACAYLGSVEADPDIEFVGMSNAAWLKEQKARYVKALLSAIGSLKDRIAVAQADTEYETILLKRSILGDFIEHALKTNAAFRNVFMGYGNYFNGIKRSFKELENGISMLKLDIDSGTPDFSNYETLVEAIEKLNSMQRELGIESNIEAPQRASKNVASEADIKNTEEMMRQLSSEINGIDIKIHPITASINAMLKPIERAARKYDHESKKRLKLVDVIENPMSMLKDADAYARFSAMLKEMLENISSVEADEKESELAKGRIAAVLNSNMHALVLEASKLEEQKSQLLSELGAYKIRLAELGTMRESSEEAARESRLIKENRKKLSSEISSLAHAIGELFYSYYNIRVTIIL
ncbi:MAG: hypothetical protein ACP5UH_02760 [Candidatus Micrarchaeia archaeon]